MGLTRGFFVLSGLVAASAVVQADPAPDAAPGLGTVQRPLWNLAAQISEKQRVPPDDPQPVGTWGGGSAPKLHNQDLKVALWGPPEALTWSLSKTDVWDRRYYPEPPLPLSKVLEHLKTADWGDPYYKSYHVYDFPCPKPVGQIILRCADLQGAENPVAETQCLDAQTSLTMACGEAKASIRSLTMMTRNLIIIEADYEGIKSPVSVRLYRHKDTVKPGESWQAGGIPEPKPSPGYDYSKDTGNGPIEPPTAGTEGRFMWIRQRLPAEMTFPSGFEYVMMALVLGPQNDMTVVEGQTGLGTPPRFSPEKQKAWDAKAPYYAHGPKYDPIGPASGSAATATIPQAPHTEFTVLTTVVTTAEASDPFTAARQLLIEAESAGIAKLKAENQGWWKVHYECRESGRTLYRDDQRNLQVARAAFNSWQSYHTGGTCPDPFKFEGDASYAFMEQDWAAWHADNHFNEAEYAGTIVSNQIDRLEMWFRIGDFLLPLARKNARDVYGLPGAMYGLCHVPIKSADLYHGNVIWEQSMEMTAQLAKMYWQRYQYTGDQDFLRKRAYPVLQAGAQFYAQYVTQGDDGLYHVIPTVSAEHWGLTKGLERNRDSTSALSLIKYHLRAAAEAARILGADTTERENWIRIADKMAPYPTCDTPDGPIFVDMRGAPSIDYNLTAPVYPTTLGDDINLDSDPKEIEIMIRTARKIKGWHVGSALMLLGQSPGTGPENLLNCRSGRIRLFPCVPKDLDFGFQRFLAVGAFEVSAERQKNRVTRLTIKSRAGNVCDLVNPWPGEKTAVVDEATGGNISCEVVAQRDEGIRFATDAGHAYVIRVTPK